MQVFQGKIKDVGTPRMIMDYLILNTIK